MGPKFSRLFLYAATCTASNVRWLPRRVARADARAPGRTTADHAKPARRGWDDSGHGTPSGSPWRSASMSIARWDTRTPSLPPAIHPATANARLKRASEADQARAWRPAPPTRLRLRRDAIGKLTLWTCRPDATPLPLSGRCPAVPSLDADDAPTSRQIHVVSCNMYRQLPYITFAKLNSSGCNRDDWPCPTGTAAQTGHSTRCTSACGFGLGEETTAHNHAQERWNRGSLQLAAECPGWLEKMDMGGPSTHKGQYGTM